MCNEEIIEPPELYPKPAQTHRAYSGTVADGQRGLVHVHLT